MCSGVRLECRRHERRLRLRTGGLRSRPGRGSHWPPPIPKPPGQSRQSNRQPRIQAATKPNRGSGTEKKKRSRRGAVATGSWHISAIRRHQPAESAAADPGVKSFTCSTSQLSIRSNSRWRASRLELTRRRTNFRSMDRGLKGYGKRYAADFGDQVSSGFWSDFFWPVVLKEDPRYFRLGHGRFIHRLGYGLAQEFVVPHRQRGRILQLLQCSGCIFGREHSPILTIPQSDRGVGLTARGASFALAYGSLGHY